VKSALIVAMTTEGLMGRNNGLPWHYSEDLKHFKRTTKGHAVIMGRKTFESLLRDIGGPLPNRVNLVVSRSHAPIANDGEVRHGARWFGSITQAASWLQQSLQGEEAPEVFIIGGAEVFKLALRPLGQYSSTVSSFAKYEGGGLLRLLGLPPDRLIVTWVPKQPVLPGDVVFPFKDPQRWLAKHYDIAQEWRDESGLLRFVVYHRKSKPTKRRKRAESIEKKPARDRVHRADSVDESVSQRRLFS